MRKKVREAWERVKKKFEKIFKNLAEPCGCGTPGCTDIPELTEEDFKRARRVKFYRLNRNEKPSMPDTEHIWNKKSYEGLFDR